MCDLFNAELKSYYRGIAVNTFISSYFPLVIS
jgi:hypothetical protein